MPMSDYQIRLATLQDSASIDAAAYASARQHHELLPGVFARPDRASNEWSAAVLAARDGAVAYAAEAGGEVVGFVHAEIVREQRPMFTPGSYGKVNHIAVVPARRSQGIGRRLMAAAEAWLLANGCKEVRLNAWHLNARAVTLYASLGYGPMSTIMSKELIDAVPGAQMPDPPAGPVSLRPITADTVRQVTALAVAPDQQRFVASNAVSLAQALFAPEAWYRAIYVGDTLAGFVMLYDESLRDRPPERPAIEVWRFMIDARHQRRGLGRAALLAAIEHVRAKRCFASLELSYVPEPGNAEPFYRQLGFVPTGEMNEGEVVMSLTLDG
jgi:diamine N-acetyltransferase